MIDQADRLDPECAACDDSGWIIKRCGGSDRVCGRPQQPLEHEWADVCPCRPMNRTYQRKVESSRRVA